jgi:fucose 4-O-acetylase-like acetyltransferase
MRSIAILLIMLAHVMPPNALFQVRNFDVPIMALLLGGSFVLSYKKQGYFSYVLKRFKRLVIPAWIFLTIFLVIVFIYDKVTRNAFFSFDDIKCSFLLIQGIGYVWIIRVFFLIAVLSPLLYLIATKVKFIGVKLVVMSALFVAQTYLIKLENLLFAKQPETNLKFFFSITFGYAILALAGMWVIKQRVWENVATALYFAVVLALTNHGQGLMAMQTNKYPPAVFFLSYGGLMATVLLLLFSIPKLKQLVEKVKFPKWISTNSLNLYYWHIFAIFFIVTQNAIPHMGRWYVRYIAVVVFAISGTLIQNAVLDFEKK